MSEVKSLHKCRVGSSPRPGNDEVRPVVYCDKCMCEVFVLHSKDPYCACPIEPRKCPKCKSTEQHVYNEECIPGADPWHSIGKVKP
jgi:hypothetical protein